MRHFNRLVKELNIDVKTFKPFEITEAEIARAWNLFLKADEFNFSEFRAKNGKLTSAAWNFLRHIDATDDDFNFGFNTEKFEKLSDEDFVKEVLATLEDFFNDWDFSNLHDLDWRQNINQCVE